MRRTARFFLLLAFVLAVGSSSVPQASGVGQDPGPRAAATGVISGQVFDAVSGLPFASGFVRILNLDRSLEVEVPISLGRYTATVDAGYYLVQTRAGTATTGYIDQLYRLGGNLDAPSWYNTTDLGWGTPVLAAPVGARPTIIDFTLGPGGMVSGVVTDAVTSAPVAGVKVSLRTANGGGPAPVATNASGEFTVIGLPTGTYTAETSNTLGYINETWDNITCYLCAGTPIPVTAGTAAPVTGINFALTPGVRVSGRVTDAESGLPLVNYPVYVYDQFGRPMADGRTNASGDYLTDEGVPPGGYYVRGNGYGIYLDEVYPDVPCRPGCDYTRGTLVTAVAAPTRRGPAPRVLTGIDFALSRGGSISGVVSPTGVEGLRVEIYAENGWQFGGFTVHPSTGVYTVGSLPEGRYYVVAHGPGFITTTYGGEPCPECGPRMNGFWPALRAAGELVEVEQGLETSGVDIAMPTGGVVAGTVSYGQVPLPGLVVAVTNTSGLEVAMWESDAQGNWQTKHDLPDGTYYVRTRNDDGYIDQIFGGGDCVPAACDPTTGTPVVVAGGVGPVVNFQMAQGGVFAGKVREAATNHALRLGALFTDAAGTSLAGGRSFYGGGYLSTRGLPAGSYFGRSSGAQGYGSILYNGKPCPGWACDMSTGDPIVVPPDDASAPIPDINFTVPICPAPSQLTPKTLPPFYAGIPVSMAFTPSGGVGPYVFRGGGNAGLPPGLTLSAEGVLGGTPAGPAGLFGYTIYGIDVLGCPSVSGIYPLSVVTPGPPTVTSVKPKIGVIAGGSTVTIQGAWFLPGVRVFFGADEATSVTVVSTTQLTVVTPPHAEGLVDVRILNADGQEVTQPDAFEYVTNLPDLTIISLTGPPSAGPGQTISVTDVTRNIGAGAAPLTVTAFYLSTDAVYSHGDVLVGRRSAGVLASGASSTGPADVTIPPGTAAGKYFLLARADALSDAPETNETNNVRAKTLRMAADLTILTLAGPKGAGLGELIEVGDTTKNLGPGGAPASVTRYYLSDNVKLEAADVLLGERRVPALAAGAKDAGTIEVTVPADTAPGNYFLIAVADGAKAISEINEVNNLQTQPIRIGCDLTMLALTGPLVAAPGATITLNQKIKNLGPGDAPPSTTRYYLSTDGIVNAGDVDLGGRAEPGIAGFGTLTETVSIFIPPGTAPRLYQILAVVDGERVIPELNERNNTRKKGIRVLLLIR